MKFHRTARAIVLFACVTGWILFMTSPKSASVINNRDAIPGASSNMSRVPTTAKHKAVPPSRTPPYNWAAAAMRFHHRMEHLRKTCGWDPKYHLKRIWRKNSNFLFDVPSRLLICAVPKSGSTSWHRTIWALRREREGLSIDQKLYTYKDTSYNQRMVNNISVVAGTKLVRRVIGDDQLWQDPPQDSSYKIILARHPFARIISGWHQKFMIQSDYWVYLFKAYQKLLDFKKQIDKEHVMSFRDFAKYIVENGGAVDFHFKPASILCQPCNYDYVYIVKAESFDADGPWLLKRLNLTHLNVGRRGTPPGGSLVNNDLVANIKKYMSQLSPDLIQKLYEYYKYDFQFFGYTFNMTTLEAGGFE